MNKQSDKQSAGSAARLEFHNSPDSVKCAKSIQKSIKRIQHSGSNIGFESNAGTTPISVQRDARKEALTGHTDAIATAIQAISSASQAGEMLPIHALEDTPSTFNNMGTLPTDVYHTTETETAEQIIESRGYVLQEKLGSGAFAIVYKAWHISEQYYSACKVIEMGKKKRKRLNDLRHELFVLERMDHANIVKLYEHFIIDDRVYIFMECASGGTLSEHVRKRGPLRELRARRWFKQICSAVQHMHSKGISHRDLKLGNILLDEMRQCKITDFGLSRLSYKSGQGVLYCSSYCGTEPYMAPEIIKKDELGKRCYDPLVADIWALGVCLYAMVNKAYPFNPEDKENMIVNQLQRKWKFVKKQRYRLSTEVKDLVRHMLEPDPKRRITFLGICSHPWMTDELEHVEHLEIKKTTSVIDTNISTLMNTCPKTTNPIPNKSIVSKTTPIPKFIKR